MKYFIVFDFLFWWYLYLTGYTLFFFVRPKWIPNLWGVIFGPPLYGLAILCIGAAYVVWIGLPVRVLNWIGLGLVLSSVILLIKQGGLKHGFPRKALVPAIKVGVACLLSAEAFLLPSLSSDGTFSTPIHLGVDAAGYGITANYLTTWKDRESLGKELLEETNLENLATAKSRNSESLNFQIEVTSEFILKALRWSYPTLTASLTELFGFDSVYRILFRALFPSVTITFLLVFWFARDLSKSYLFPILIAASVLLNCNLLNLALQGQYAQALSAPLFLFLLVTVFKHRQSGEHFSWRSLCLASLSPALIIGALMVLYNEAIVVFAIFVFLVALLDFIMLKRGPGFSFVVFVTTFIAIGLMLAWPITIEWLFFLKKHFVNIRTAGWWQPHWANPAEIFGIANIYSEFTTHEVMRKPLPFATSIFFSILICALLFFSWRNGKKTYDWSIIGAAILFPFLVFLKTFFFERIHNYQYMKSYTMFLPFLTLWMFLCIGNLVPKDSFAKQLKTCLLGSMFGLIIFNGSIYLYKAINDRYLARESFYESLQALDKLRGHAIWVYQPKNVHQPEKRTFLFGGITNFLWLNRDAKRLVAHHQNERIAVLFFKVQQSQQRLRKSDSIVLSSQILFENDLLEIIDTSFFVRDFVDDQSVFINMDRLTEFIERNAI